MTISPLKFYLAAKFSRREEMEGIANRLKDLGLVPNCRWVYGGEEGLSRHQIAELDLEDVRTSDMIILFTHERGSLQPGGGRFVEFGYAMALDKLTVVIGPPECVFLEHHSVESYETLEDFIKNGI